MAVLEQHIVVPPAPRSNRAAALAGVPGLLPRAGLASAGSSCAETGCHGLGDGAPRLMEETPAR